MAAPGTPGSRRWAASCIGGATSVDIGDFSIDASDGADAFGGDETELVKLINIPLVLVQQEDVDKRKLRKACVG